MESIEAFIDVLKNGSEQEKAKALIELSKLTNNRAAEALRNFSATDRSMLSVMAACALLLLDSRSTKEPGDERLCESENIVSAGIPTDLLDFFSFLTQTKNIKVLVQGSDWQAAKDRFEKLLTECEAFRTPLLWARPDLVGLFSFLKEKARGILFASIGAIELRAGNIGMAAGYSVKALKIGKFTGDKQVLSMAHVNLGVAYMEGDKYYKALFHLRRSLDAAGGLSFPWSRSRVMLDISYLYSKAGDAHKAFEYGINALYEAREEKDGIGTGRCLNRCGINSALLGKMEEALGYFDEAMRLSKENRDWQTEGEALLNSGFLYFKNGDTSSAKRRLKDALEIFSGARDKNRQATALVALAHVCIQEKDIEMSRELAERALELARETASIKDDADACFILGSIHDIYYGESEKAYRYYEEAITLFENIRKETVIDDLKISYTENITPCYEKIIGLCVRTGMNEIAFEHVERSKSRALVELLAKTSEKIRPHALSSDNMRELAGLRQRLVILKNALRRLYTKTDVLGCINENLSEQDSQEREALSAIFEIEDRYRAAYEEVKRLDPEFASFTKTDPITFEEAARLLDRDTRLIEYYQASDGLYIFVVSPELQILSFKVEGDPYLAMENAVRVIDSIGCGIVASTESHDYHRDILNPLANLYRLLIGPAEDAIQGAKRLVIIPHLFWHHVPFHTAYDEKRGEFLIDRYEICYAPSADVLRYCKLKNDCERERAVIFANPTGDLAYAEEEAQRVSGCFWQGARLFTGNEASIEELRNVEDADILHLACHGIFREDEPIFSHLMMSDGKGGKDACFLSDIFNLKLGTPTLVTLSACESGLNRHTAGDDLIGFTRGLFYAGTASVIATLWRVNDISTSLFMQEFYRNFVIERLTKSESLRLAALKLKNTQKYSHPYFWAPFYLSGDWA